MFLIIMGLLISKNKRYSICHINIYLEDAQKKKVRQQIKWFIQRKIVNNLVRGFTCNQRRYIIEYRLYIKKHLGPQKEIFKGINKKLQYNI